MICCVCCGGGGSGGGGGQCPAANPLSDAECAGAVSNCWSPGQSDTDCPNFGLCCFDGCANTCVDGPQSEWSGRNPLKSAANCAMQSRRSLSSLGGAPQGFGSTVQWVQLRLHVILWRANLLGRGLIGVDGRGTAACRLFRVYEPRLGEAIEHLPAACSEPVTFRGRARSTTPVRRVASV